MTDLGIVCGSLVLVAMVTGVLFLVFVALRLRKQHDFKESSKMEKGVVIA